MRFERRGAPITKMQAFWGVMQSFVCGESVCVLCEILLDCFSHFRSVVVGATTAANKSYRLEPDFVTFFTLSLLRLLYHYRV